MLKNKTNKTAENAEPVIAVEKQGLGLSNFLSHPTAPLLLTSSSYPLFSTEFKRSAINKQYGANKMKRLCILSFLLMFLLISCKKPTTVVVLDGWWDADYTKNSCEAASEWRKENADLIAQLGCKQLISCKEMMNTFEACTPNPLQKLRKFEKNLAKEFANGRECQSVQFLYYSGPNESSEPTANAILNQHYGLALDFDPGALKQQWTLNLSNSKVNRAIAHGRGTVKEIANKICATVNKQIY